MIMTRRTMTQPTPIDQRQLSLFEDRFDAATARAEELDTIFARAAILLGEIKDDAAELSGILPDDVTSMAVLLARVNTMNALLRLGQTREASNDLHEGVLDIYTMVFAMMRRDGADADTLTP